MIPYEIPKNVLERVGPDIGELAKKKSFYRGKGCRRCNNTGYLGRMGTLETFMVDDTIRDMIIQRKSVDEIKRYAVSKGMKTLRENALKKFAQGLTSLEEVLRITSEE